VRGRVLIIAGSDSGGGAGIQADIKAVTALDGFAATAITALTAQDTQGVHAIHDVPPAFIAQQIAVVLADLGADAVKTGMLGTAAAIATVADALAAHARDVPLVVDPVMVAKGGARLLAAEATQALIARLLPRADLLTPNAPEAAALTGLPIATREDLIAAARRLRAMGARAVLAKGGHLPGATIADVFADGAHVEILESPRIDTRSTHGTGCTLASAIAVGLAQGLSKLDAVRRARAYVREALRTAPGFGRGHGPLNHAHTVRPFPA
jgi:hydroxymethylpyrimidine/phosphomethylpyrimidine kinase